MSMITVNVTVKSISHFERENTHVKLRYPERFVAITLVGQGGQHYVTLTRKHSGFAEAVKVGENLTVSGNVKREQDYHQLGGQVVLTNCVIGTPEYVMVSANRKAKAAKRLAKLGL